jgi:hypothetical protein
VHLLVLQRVAANSIWLLWLAASLFADCRWLPAFNCCHCPRVGPDAAEIMQGLAIALKCGATKAQFDATVGIHPSAAEVGVTDWTMKLDMLLAEMALLNQPHPVGVKMLQSEMMSRS